MPRKPRQFEIGGVYHIVQRGVERRRLFMKNQDYSRFTIGLELFNSEAPARLWELLAKAGSDPALRDRLREQRTQKLPRLVDILAFALMPNHFHLILREIVQGGISAFMQKMGGYATYFNKQYDRTGSLFQGRYKSIEVSSNEQLLKVFVYVHTNPVELWEPEWKEFRVHDAKGALRRLQAYHWSSYRDYLGMPTFPHVIQPEFFLETLGGVEGCRKAVEDWVTFKAEQADFGPEIIE